MEQRIAAIEQSVKRHDEVNANVAREQFRNHARHMAVFTMVQEIAARLGVSEESFHHYYDERVKYYHAAALRQLEDESPGIAARVDTRRPEEVSTGESYPPMHFPPHS